MQASSDCWSIMSVLLPVIVDVAGFSDQGVLGMLASYLPETKMAWEVPGESERYR